MRQARLSAVLGVLIGATVILTACRDSGTGTVTDADHSLRVQTVNPIEGKFGTEITVSGAGFGNQISDIDLTINGKEAEILSSTTQTITAVVPEAAKSGPVIVTVNGQTTQGPIFNYIPTIKVTTLAGSGLLGLRDGKGVNAQFNFPVGLDLMENGDLVVVDYWNHSIRIVTPDGTVSTLAGNGEPGSRDGVGADARFFRPIDVEVTDDGSFLVSDFGNHRIRQITPSGRVTTFSGTVVGYQNGPPYSAQFSYPAGIAQADDDTLFVSDSGNNRVRWVAPNGDVGTFAGSGAHGFENGYGELAEFSFPFGLDLGTNNRIFIADYGNNSIRLISSEHVVSTLTGSRETDSFNAEGTDARFNAPYDVVVDDNNNIIYVADYKNNRIRRISPQREVTNIAGDGTAGFTDGDETQARFNRPIGLAINDDGTVLYVADHFNHAIRKIKIE
ncbi:MAG: IPT/TIG domain-containing protein [Balneolaceae bacterium]|nr:IPT/TIG domain-containing protein [Balneolaceae bacterium]